MYFVKWLFRRIKLARFEWAQGYRRLILEETFLSIMFTLIGGVVLYVIPVCFLLIPYIDRADTAVTIIWGLVASVVTFYVYHWIQALHQVYKQEQQQMWKELKND